jgi:steroid delta-isomerase-like uncharacterized protein
MSDTNRQLAQRWFEEIWNARNANVVDELLSQDGVGHMEGGDVRGRAQFHAVRNTLLDAFPDLRITVEDTVAEADQVVVRWRVSATHKGAGLGFAATNRPVEFRGLTWLRFSNGLIVEGWDSWNEGALLQSLKAATPSS